MTPARSTPRCCCSSRPATPACSGTRYRRRRCQGRTACLHETKRKRKCFSCNIVYEPICGFISRLILVYKYHSIILPLGLLTATLFKYGCEKIRNGQTTTSREREEKNVLLLLLYAMICLQKACIFCDRSLPATTHCKEHQHVC